VQPNTKVEDAVILVDSKIRDLDVAALIAHHLGNLGIKCHLEPLEAYRAVIGAHKPGLIVFNHLNASHLVALSKRLHDMGVLTAVLPNEGILYDQDVARFYSNRYHNGSHIDYFLCWNEPHREALRAEGFDENVHVEVVGVPRFDFYFKPWSNLVQRSKKIESPRPKILFCTNLSTADYWELPKEQGDKLFAMWVNRVPLYTDYWPAIEAQWKGRNKIPAFLEALIDADKFEVIFRPHPVETVEFYEKWMTTLTDKQRKHFHYDRHGNVSGLILDCDLEISVETCTTALEAWIAKKPTIELVMEKNPLWYREIQAKANVPCANPSELPDLVTRLLHEPLAPDVAQKRTQHLADWCSTPDGSSSLRIARLFADALYGKKPADWSKLTLTDRRRAVKLRTMNALGHAYHFDPFLALKRRLLPKRYTMKDFIYRKSIRPKDVREAMQRLESAEATGA
jgi:surface carbohydrate biosynthesis protein